MPGVINTNIISDGRIHMADATGKSGQGKIARFYKTQGTHPRGVAKDALLKDAPVMPTPLHAWPFYLAKRLSPKLYRAGGRLIWKSGLLL